jgi:glycosyltransferase involved in cell wall biosynthesis
MLSVVIPTYNRLSVLLQTLARLANQRDPGRFEVIVVDDGSSDGTVDALRALARRAAFPLQVLEQRHRGPAAARNAAIAQSRGGVCLFLDDDAWPRPDLLARHAAFHRRRTPQDALLGRVVWAIECKPTAFMEWLHSSGIQFEFPSSDDPEPLPGRFFYTVNVSVERRLVEEVGGFDESYGTAACEDTDLGLRLQQAGMRLAYDPSAVVEHFHPLDVATMLARMRRVGEANRRLARQLPGVAPRRPGLRHRVKALALLSLYQCGAREGVRQATWAFVCHEACREGFWDVKGRREEPLRVGGRLVHLAERDPATWNRLLATPGGDYPLFA